jgi:hypothetical protein
MCKFALAASDFRGGPETVPAGLFWNALLPQRCKYPVAGNAPEIRNLGTSPPLLDECVGDYALTESGFQK